MIKKVKNTVLRIYVIEDLNGEAIVKKFYEKRLQKTNQKDIVEIHGKCKSFDNFFNSWIDKKDIV